MEYKQIQELIKTINKSNISELTVEEGDFKITIKQEITGQVQYVTAPAPAPQVQQPAPQPASHAPAPQPAAPAAEKPAAPAAASNQVTIKSPMIGTFYRSPSPDKPVFVNVGDEIKAGQVICIIEAMKLFNEIEAEVSGKIIKVLADDSSPVEYDQPLFLIEPM
jgi:acetyl-CoA carboxylase biotin carboxyl carrier protein